jgi:hypothetical protein
MALTDRQKTANVLAATLTKHAEKAHARFTDLVTPHLLEGEKVPDLVFFQELLQRHLTAIRKALVEVDDLHHRERQDDQELRATRDQAVSELAALLARLRFAVKGACGAESCGRVLGFEGSVPRDPVVLQRYVVLVKERLESGSVAEQTSTVEEVSIDSAAWIRRLEEPLSRLELALEQLSGDRRDTLEQQLAKNALLADYDRAHRSGAHILENVFRFVGLDEFAERVRPSPTRRSSPGPTEEEGDRPPAPDPPF